MRSYTIKRISFGRSMKLKHWLDSMLEIILENMMLVFRLMRGISSDLGWTSIVYIARTRHIRRYSNVHPYILINAVFFHNNSAWTVRRSTENIPFPGLRHIMKTRKHCDANLQYTYDTNTISLSYSHSALRCSCIALRVLLRSPSHAGDDIHHRSSIPTRTKAPG